MAIARIDQQMSTLFFLEKKWTTFLKTLTVKGTLFEWSPHQNPRQQEYPLIFNLNQQHPSTKRPWFFPGKRIFWGKFVFEKFGWTDRTPTTVYSCVSKKNPIQEILTRRRFPRASSSSPPWDSSSTSDTDPPRPRDSSWDPPPAPSPPRPLPRRPPSTPPPTSPSALSPACTPANSHHPETFAPPRPSTGRRSRRNSAPWPGKHIVTARRSRKQNPSRQRSKQPIENPRFLFACQFGLTTFFLTIQMQWRIQRGGERKSQYSPLWYCFWKFFQKT